MIDTATLLLFVGVPFAGALLGWLVHHLALLFFFSDILPRKQSRIAASLGKAAATEFANFAGIEEKINDPKNLESIMPVIEKHIDHFLNERLKQEMPMISMFIGNKTTDKLKEIFLKELQALFPQVIGQFARNLRSNINVEKLVTQRLESIPSSTLESIIRKNMPGLKYLPLLGGITGFITGILMAFVVLMVTR